MIAVFLGMFTLKSNVAGGLRYVLPIFPFMFILVGRLARNGVRRPPWAMATLGALALWYMGAAVSIHPHYLSYFNESIGGPKNGYRYLDGPNLDWGQDLMLLGRYMKEHDIERIKLAYFGSASAQHHGIDYEYLPSVGLTPQRPGQHWWYELDSPEKRRLEPQRGLVAVSANLLARSQWLAEKFEGTYDWLEGHEPVDTVGNSILIFDLK